jgi:formylglycine-generating enzyme required for sulfatase activity
VLEALTHHRQLTLLGKPGSGKSTFGARVLLALAQGWQGQGEAMAVLGESWQGPTLLPIRVVLRHFAEGLPASDQPLRAGDLWKFIAGDLERRGYGISADTLKYVRRAARQQGALILFDGLDECGADARRERVHGAVRELIDSLAGTASRFVLTARPYAWPRGADPVEGVYALSDLNADQVEHFIRRWYEMLEKRSWCSASDAERKCADLLQARERADLRELTGNPLLLTLMATLHTHRSRLPDDRVDLYNESVELLLMRWNQRIGADAALLDALNVPSLKLADLREVLEELAFTVHERNVGVAGTADIPEHELLQAFRPLLNNSWDKAQIVVEYIEKRAGLLLGQGQKSGAPQFTFPHRTFQEFLAARHLQSRDNFAVECARLARSAASHWELVLPLAARLAGTERGVSAADELVGGIDCSAEAMRGADWPSVRLAGAQLLEIGPGALHKSRRTRAIASRVAGWLAAVLPVHPNDGGLPARGRAHAGDLLAALGDPRFDPERLYLPADAGLGFMCIAADPQFRIGTRSKQTREMARALRREISKDEINERLTPTPEFHIGKYPVTVGQFGAFVAAAKFEIGDADALRDPLTRPVRWVSWHEALAYCEWLTEQLRTASQLASNPLAALVCERGWQVDLPSELEWEVAARGGVREAIFPWGDEPDPNRANYGDSEVYTTSSVGCFPGNAFGLYDMTGNVWEWTRSAYVDYPYDPRDGREELTAEGTRVLRGGAFRSYIEYARCAYRYRNPPVARSRSFGFRVVLRGPPVP